MPLHVPEAFQLVDLPVARREGSVWDGRHELSLFQALAARGSALKPLNDTPLVSSYFGFLLENPTDSFFLNWPN